MQAKNFVCQISAISAFLKLTEMSEPPVKVIATRLSEYCADDCKKRVKFCGVSQLVNHETNRAEVF